VALTGAVLQVVYGVLACVWTYPRITDRPFEAVWGLATLGMIAEALLDGDPRRPDADAGVQRSGVTGQQS